IGALMLLGDIAARFAKWLAGLAEKVPLLSDIAGLLKTARKKVADFSFVEGKGGAKPAEPGGTGGVADAALDTARPTDQKPTDKANADPDTTAKPGDLPAERIEAANKKLADKVADPKNVRRSSREGYDVEVDLGDGEVYARREK